MYSLQRKPEFEKNCLHEYEYENEICKKPHVEQPRPPTVVESHYILVAILNLVQI